MKNDFNQYSLCIYGIIGTNLILLVQQMQLMQCAKKELIK